jgi:hypothetical protein
MLIGHCGLEALLSRDPHDPGPSCRSSEAAPSRSHADHCREPRILSLSAWLSSPLLNAQRAFEKDNGKLQKYSGPTTPYK